MVNTRPDTRESLAELHANMREAHIALAACRREDADEAARAFDEAHAAEVAEREAEAVRWSKLTCRQMDDELRVRWHGHLYRRAGEEAELAELLRTTQVEIAAARDAAEAAADAERADQRETAQMPQDRALRAVSMDGPARAADAPGDHLRRRRPRRPRVGLRIVNLDGEDDGDDPYIEF